MKAFLLVVMLAFHPNRTGCLEMDIILLVDLSGSVSGHEQFVSDAVLAFNDRIEKSEQSIRMGVVSFGDHAEMLSPITFEKEPIAAGVSNLTADGSTTNLIQGLEMSFAALTSSDRNASKLIVVISDGAVINEAQTLTMIEQLKMIGVNFCAVLVMDRQANDAFMQVVGGQCYARANYETLAKEINKLDVCL